MKSHFFFALCATLGLTACASDPTQQPMPKILFEATKAMVAKKPNTQAQRQAIQAITREQFIGIGTDPLILVDIEQNQQYATLTQISKNGDYDTYRSGDQKTLTFSGGILTSTKGLGADLMSLDVSQTIAGLRKASGNPVKTIRIHRMLNQVNEIDTVSYICQLVLLGPQHVTSIHKDFTWLRFEETCVAEQPNISEYTNTYWVDPKSHLVWKSRQWIGKVAGYIGVDILIPTRIK